MFKFSQISSSKAWCAVRIEDAFKKYAPEYIEWTDLENCEFCLVHTYNNKSEPIIEQQISKGKKVIVFQYVYKDTAGQHPWEYYYPDCHLIVSFQDLKKKTDNTKYQFYRTALGYDPDHFSFLNLKRDIKVFTTGHVPQTEKIDQVWEACKKLGITLHHSGQSFKYPTNYMFHKYEKDYEEFNKFLNRVEYITGLRENEGFEMMAVEVLACGGRPIVPDLPCYDWYFGHAHYVNLGKNIPDQVASILVNPSKPVSEREMGEVYRKFAWPEVVKRIFLKILLP